MVMINMKHDDVLESIRLIDEQEPVHYIVLKDGRLAPVLSGGLIEFAIQELGGEVADLEEDPSLELAGAR
jgi:hypothetical protein